MQDWRNRVNLSLLTQIKSNHLCSSVLVDRHQRSRDIIIVPESFCLNPRHLVSSVSCQWLEEDHLVDSERCQVSDWWPDGECQLNVTCGYNTITTCNLHSREGWKSEKTGSWPNTSNLLYDPHHPLQQLPNTDWLTDWVSKWLTHQLTEECMRKILIEPGEDWEKNCKRTTAGRSIRQTQRQLWISMRKITRPNTQSCYSWEFLMENYISSHSTDYSWLGGLKILRSGGDWLM